MTITITLTDIFIFLIAIAFFILVLYTIPAITQLRQTMRSIQELSDVLKGQAKELEVVVKGVSQFAKPITMVAGLITGIVFGLRKSRKEGKEDVRE